MLFKGFIKNQGGIGVYKGASAFLGVLAVWLLLGLGGFTGLRVQGLRLPRFNQRFVRVPRGV